MLGDIVGIGLLAMGLGEHVLCAKLTGNGTQPSRHQPLVRQHHPFPGRRGPGFLSYSAKAKPSKRLPWHPFGDDSTAMLSGIVLLLCLGPTPTFNYKCPLSSSVEKQALRPGLWTGPGGY